MRRYGTVLVLSALVVGAAGCGGRSSAPPPGPVAMEDLSGSLAVARSHVHRIGPDDLLEVTVFEAPELSRTARVGADGSISLPVLGSVPAAGLTATELEGALQDRLRGKYMVDPHVSIEVAEVRNHPIYVLGAVRRPGAFPLNGFERLTFLRALAMGEGLEANAAGGRAFIIRVRPDGERLEIPVDVGDVIAGHAVDPELEPNDVIFVPSSPVKSLARGVADALIRIVSLGRIF